MYGKPGKKLTGERCYSADNVVSGLVSTGRLRSGWERQLIQSRWRTKYWIDGSFWESQTIDEKSSIGASLLIDHACKEGAVAVIDIHDLHSGELLALYSSVRGLMVYNW